MSIYDRIRELRIANNMSQTALAHKLGYKDGSMITKIESGKVDISQKKVVAFAKALDTTPAYLMGWTDDEKDNGRRLPVFIPDNETFLKIANAMTPTDYETVMSIFEKTYNRMKERGEIE